MVLDSGFGDGLEAWEKVFTEIALFARLVAYDRAGLGESEPGPQPRSFTQIGMDPTRYYTERNLLATLPSFRANIPGMKAVGLLAFFSFPKHLWKQLRTTSISVAWWRSDGERGLWSAL